MFHTCKTNYGCCGLAWNFEAVPISLFGWVDTQEEADDFLRRCKEQLTYLKKDYKSTNPPSYWTFRVPNENKWIVSFQIQRYTNASGNTTFSCFDYEKELKLKELVYTKAYDSYSMKKVYNKEFPMDVYKNGSKGASDPIQPIANFGTSLSDFKARIKDEKERHPLNTTFKCVLYALKESAPIFEWISKNYTIIFEKDWHNPAYAETGEDYDIHMLKTLIFVEKDKT